MEELISSYGFRSIVNAKWQSWGGFTMSLFANDKIRGEFDRVNFIFNLEVGSNYKQEDEIDDYTLDAAYFGRDIEVTTFYLPSVPDLKGKLEVIKEVFRNFVTHTKKDKLSQPQLVISNITDSEIEAYYLWQYQKG